VRLVRELRSVVKGHAAPAKKTTAAQKALKNHGSFHAHFKSLAAGCDEALDLIMSLMNLPKE
jgi:hypothetical protein